MKNYKSEKYLHLKTRIATIIYRYAKANGYDVSVGENTNIFSYTDFEEISEYAIKAMQYPVQDRQS